MGRRCVGVGTLKRGEEADDEDALARSRFLGAQTERRDRYRLTHFT
jgi:hypothetical protein